ncbi:MAG: class I SAM-dependent methyltransferase [Verrucomicrobiota bacterium]
METRAGFTHHLSRIAMKRLVQPELLDTLPADDPRAIHSRRDLRRINAWMRNHAIMAAALQTAANGCASKQITDLGAGDGHFLVRVAKIISPRWPGVRVTLLDNRKIMGLQTLASFTPLGWHAEAVAADVFNWLPAAAGLDIVVANLFLHHFADVRLLELFRAVAGRARLCVAIEPRRAFWPLFCCRLLWLIGCNAVTRHDAAVSVRAGFSSRELSALWPADSGWQLTERRAGFFSHLFVAWRMD